MIQSNKDDIGDNIEPVLLNSMNELKVFEELSKLDPPDPQQHYTAFTYRMGIMVAELINKGIITLEEGKAAAVELSNMDGSVRSLMKRIWPNYEPPRDPAKND